jgi:hypothetical protein
MVVPMSAWMRVRGCGWRDGAEMGVAMLLPQAAILGLLGSGLSDRLPWLSNSSHMVMLVGMHAFMLYRRERYTSEYSLLRWPVVPAGRRSSQAELAEAGQPPAPVRTG